MGRIITEPVKKVKLIADDVTFIFDNPRIVHLLTNGDHNGNASHYRFDLEIETFDQPTVFRTVKKDGVIEYERLA